MKKTTTEFDEATHVYRINNFIVPSVTGIIGDLLPGFRADEWYMERGRVNHQCYAYLGLNQNFTPDPRCQPNIDAWHAWRMQMGDIEFISVERQVFSKKYMYAGTMDAIIKWQDELYIIDYKQSMTDTTSYQLGGYANILKQEKLRIKKGFGVQLSEKGFKMSEVYDLNVYGQKFLTLLSAYNIRAEHGKTEE